MADAARNRGWNSSASGVERPAGGEITEFLVGTIDSATKNSELERHLDSLFGCLLRLIQFYEVAIRPCGGRERGLEICA